MTKKDLTFEKLPKYLTTDIEDSCYIYELVEEIPQMDRIEACYSAIRVVRYDGTDTVIECAKGENVDTIFLTMKWNTKLPTEYRMSDERILELTWYEEGTSLSNIETMCSL